MKTTRSAKEEPSFQGCNITLTDLARPVSTYLHVEIELELWLYLQPPFVFPLQVKPAV